VNEELGRLVGHSSTMMVSGTRALLQKGETVRFSAKKAPL
jgi:hypothetical protein